MPPPSNAHETAAARKLAFTPPSNDCLGCQGEGLVRRFGPTRPDGSRAVIGERECGACHGSGRKVATR